MLLDPNFHLVEKAKSLPFDFAFVLLKVSKTFDQIEIKMDHENVQYNQDNQGD